MFERYEGQLPDTPKHIHLIQTEERVNQAVSHLLRFDVLGFDVETYNKFDRRVPAFDPISGARMRLAQFCTPEGRAFVFDLYKVDVRFLYRMFPNPYVCVIQNAKFEMKFLMYELGIYDFGPVFDTMLAEQVLSKGNSIKYSDPNYVPVGLDAIAKRRLGVHLPKDEQAGDWYKSELTEKQIAYAARDACIVLPIMEQQTRRLVEQSQVRVAELEFECVAPITSMELNGVYLDDEKWLTLCDQTQIELDKVKHELWDMLGLQNTLFEEIAPINLNSKLEIARGFNNLGIEIPLDKDGKRSLKVDNLGLVDHEAVRKYLKWVKLDKAIGSFGPDWLDKRDQYTKRIHCTIKQIGAETGRAAASNPNMMQMKSGDEYRNAFMAQDGWVFIASDYSQVELRILAELCRDPNMISVYDKGLDLHTYTASLVYKCKLEEVTKVQRSIAKNLNFGICFHGDTEILTNKGWICIKYLTLKDVVAQATIKQDGKTKLQWVKPVKLTKRFSKTLLNLESRFVSLNVTPDHKFTGLDYLRRPKTYTARQLHKAEHTIHAGTLKEGTKVSSRLLRLAVAVQADGNIQRKGLVRIRVKKERKIERLKSLLRPEEYSIFYEAGGTVTGFLFKKELGNKILALLNRKRFSWDLLNLNYKGRSVIVKESQFWDGHKQKGAERVFHYSSSIEQNIDVLQALATTCGRKTNKMKVNRVKNPDCKEWLLAIYDYNWAVNRKVLKTTEINHNDSVYCLEVPSHNVVVRHDGKIIISQQCYGIGSSKFAAQSKLSTDEAESIMSYYLKQAYPQLGYWLESQSRLVLFNLESVTMTGRVRRYHEDLHDKQRKSAVQRNAKNYPIQGGSADITKRALALVYKEFKGQQKNIKMNLVIHDEILIESRPEYAEYASHTLQECMLKAEREYLHRIPSVVDTSMTLEWAKDPTKEQLEAAAALLI